MLAVLPSIWCDRSVAGSQQIPLGSSNFNDQKPLLQSSYWYEAINHNGEASFMQPSCKTGYQVFRNVVTDFGADNTGNNDASTAIQNAIDCKLSHVCRR